MRSARYVYAIVHRNTPLPFRTGRGNVELVMVPWRALAAVTERVSDVEMPLTLDGMLQHEAVVEAVRQLGPALPVRFGTVFRDAASVAAALAERYDSLVADLDRLGDKVEVSLTALWTAQPDPQPPAEHARASGRSEGASYLYALGRELQRDEALRQRARAVASALDDVLGQRALERRVSLLPTPRVAVRSAYLLDAAVVRDFRYAFDGLRRERQDVRLLLTGPWPPYTFVKHTTVEGGLAAPLAALADALVRSDPEAPRLSGRGAQVNN